MSLHPHLIALSARIRDHLLAQRARAFEGRCKYRTTGGLKCAVGGAIDDEDYKRGFDTCMADGGSPPPLGGDPLILLAVRTSSARRGQPLPYEEVPDHLLATLLEGWQVYHDDRLAVGDDRYARFGDWLEGRQPEFGPAEAHTFLITHL